MTHHPPPHLLSHSHSRLVSHHVAPPCRRRRCRREKGCMASPLRTCNGPPLSSRRRAPADGLLGLICTPLTPPRARPRFSGAPAARAPSPRSFYFVCRCIMSVRLNGGNLGRLVDTGRWDTHGGSETVVSKGRHTLLLWESSRASAHHPLPPYCLLPPAPWHMILGEFCCH